MGRLSRLHVPVIREGVEDILARAKLYFRKLCFRIVCTEREESKMEEGKLQERGIAVHPSC